MNFVNINGDPWRPQVGAAPKAKPKKDRAAEYHKGYAVEGHPPGALEAARAMREQEIQAWSRLSEAEKAERISQGKRAPSPWPGDEAWMANTKLKRVRSKPYELPQAADECAELAKRAGWLCVRVTALTRRAA